MTCVAVSCVVSLLPRWNTTYQRFTGVHFLFQFLQLVPHVEGRLISTARILRQAATDALAKVPRKTRIHFGC